MATSSTTQNAGKRIRSGAAESQTSTTDGNATAASRSSDVEGDDRLESVSPKGSVRSSGGRIGDDVRQLVRDKAYEQIDSQKERATGTLGAVAGAVRSATQGLRDSGQPALADYATRAADGMERWTSRLREQDLDDILREAQEFARRRPAIFLGVAFGVGVLVARFLKSSEDAGSRDIGRRASWTSSHASTYTNAPSVAHDAADFPHASSSTEGAL